MQGVNVIDDSAEIYHVSGHANRPDLEEIHRLLKPKTLIPMHGEYRHLKEHSELAASKGIESLIVPNGSVVEIGDKGAKIVDHIETGRIYLDGSRLIGAYDGVVLDRIRMATRGTVAISLVIEGTEVLQMIRSNKEVEDIAVVAVTSYAMAGDREKLMAAGCNGYIEKPIDPFRILEELEIILKEQQ